MTTPIDFPFVCFECGWRFRYRYLADVPWQHRRDQLSLEGHWNATGHGPANVQASSTSKVRNLFLTGEAGPDDSPAAPVVR